MSAFNRNGLKCLIFRNVVEQIWIDFQGFLLPIVTLVMKQQSIYEAKLEFHHFEREPEMYQSRQPTILGLPISTVKKQLSRTIITILISFILVNTISYLGIHKSQSFTFFEEGCIVVSKNIRGIFPPLMGDADLLIGSYQLALIVEAEESVTLTPYTLQIEPGKFKIVDPNCSKQLIFTWTTYSYNLILHPEAIKGQNQNNCTLAESRIAKLLPKSSIWSRYKEPIDEDLLRFKTTLYILVENHTSNSLDSILIFIEK